MADANVSQLEINGTTYDICDATARDSLSQFQTTVQNTYLPLTGGTMTGKLTVDGARVESIDSFMVAKNTAIDRNAANPSSDQWGTGLLLLDKNDEDIGTIRPLRYADGRVALRLNATHEKSNGTTVENVISIVIAKDGTQTYGVSNPANFRSAIGALASSWPNTQSLTVTRTSNVKEGNFWAMRSGNVVVIGMFASLAPITAWQENFQIGTVSGISAKYSEGILYVQDSSRCLNIYIEQNSGKIYIRNKNSIPFSDYTWVFGTLITLV